MEAHTFTLESTNNKFQSFNLNKTLKWSKTNHKQIDASSNSHLFDNHVKTKLFDILLSPTHKSEPFISTMVTNRDNLGDIANLSLLKPIIKAVLIVSVIAASILVFADIVIYPILVFGFSWMMVHSFTKRINLKYTDDPQVLKSGALNIYELRWGEGSRISFKNHNKGIALIGINSNKLVGMHLPLKDYEGNYVVSCSPEHLANEAKEVFDNSSIVYMIGDKGFWDACGASQHYNSITKAVSAKELCYGSGKLYAKLKNKSLSIVLNGKNLI